MTPLVFLGTGGTELSGHSQTLEGKLTSDLEALRYENDQLRKEVNMQQLLA